MSLPPLPPGDRTPWDDSDGDSRTPWARDDAFGKRARRDDERAGREERSGRDDPDGANPGRRTDATLHRLYRLLFVLVTLALIVFYGVQLLGHLDTDPEPAPQETRRAAGPTPHIAWPPTDGGR